MAGIETVQLDREPYPEATAWVAMYERIATPRDWEMLRRVYGGDVGKLLRAMQKDADEAIAEGDKGTEFIAMRPQMDTDDFKRYLSGKFGLL